MRYMGAVKINVTKGMLQHTVRNRPGQALKGLSLTYDEFFRPESDL